MKSETWHSPLNCGNLKNSIQVLPFIDMRQIFMLFPHLIFWGIEMHLHALKYFAHNLNNFILIYLTYSTFNRVHSYWWQFNLKVTDKMVPLMQLQHHETAGFLSTFALFPSLW